MTTVLGCVENGKVYIGADSQFTSGWMYFVSGEKKVFRVQDVLFACSGTLRDLQSIRYLTQFPNQSPDETDDIRYLVTVVAEAIRVSLRDQNRIKKENELEDAESDFLVGYRNRLYRLHGDGAFAVCPTPVACLGTGGELALGAFLARPELPPQERILQALAIAGQLDIATRPPYYVEVLE